MCYFGGMVLRRKFALQESCKTEFLQCTFVPRTAPVWHPIEELSACFRIAVNCTDKSLSIRERLASPPVVQFRAEASEGFQGAGAFGRICAELLSTRTWRGFPQSSVIKSGLKGDRAVSHWTYPENAKKEPGAWPLKWFNVCIYFLLERYT